MVGSSVSVMQKRWTGGVDKNQIVTAGVFDK